MVLPSAGGARVQVVVDPAGESGSRGVWVYSRGAGPDSVWVLHAQGALSPASSDSAADLSVWPPAGASEIDAGDAYDVLARRGYEYGPAFRGLRALWRRGTEVFAEVAVGEGVAVAGFGIHPVVLDAALHAWGVADGGDATMLPFSWQGVCLHAAGASRVRVRIAPAGTGAVSVDLADASGPARPVRARVDGPSRLGAGTIGRSGGRRGWRRCRCTKSHGQQRPWTATTLATMWWCGSRAREPTACWARCTRPPMRRWKRCSRGWPAMDLGCWRCRLTARWVWPVSPSRIWRLRRCGGWCVPRRPSIRVGWCWSIRTDRWISADVIGPSEPQVVVRSGVAHAARLAAVGAGAVLELPAGGWRLAAGGGGTLEDVVVTPAEPRRVGRRTGAGGGGRGRGEFPGCVGGVGDVSRRRRARGRGCRRGRRGRSRGRRGWPSAMRCWACWGWSVLRRWWMRGS